MKSNTQFCKIHALPNAVDPIEAGIAPREQPVRRAARRARRILYVQYTNPAGYPPLEHSGRILAEAGWRVEFLGIGALGADRLEMPPHPNLRVRKLRFVRAGWQQKLHYAGFAAWVLTRVLLWRPRWVYVSDALASPVGLLLTWLPGVRVLYHEHDSPATEAYDSTSGFMRWVLRCRRKLAQRAEVNVLPSRGRVAAFRASVQTHRPTVCVWNCPMREEVAPEVPDLVPSEPLRLFYHGSIVPARLPRTVIEAMKQVEGVHLEVAGYETVGHRGYVKELQAYAARLGVADRFNYLGTLPSRTELLAACRRAHVGLALMPRQSADLNEQTMAGASNKPFEYLACGLALLVSDLPDWRELFVESGFALTCQPDHARTIAEALEWFRDHPAARQRMGRSGRDRIQAEWNYETQFAPVLRLLEEVG